MRDPEEYLASLHADLSKAEKVKNMMLTEGWGVYAEALDMIEHISRHKFMREEISPEQHRAELKAVFAMRDLGHNLIGSMTRIVGEIEKIESTAKKRKGLRQAIGRIAR